MTSEWIHSAGRFTLRACLLGALFLGVRPEAVAADCTPVREDLDVPNGNVYALATLGDTLYLGGSFTLVGPSCGGWLPMFKSSGDPPASFPRVAGTVRAIVSDGAGGWYLGGDFIAVGQQPRRNLAHVLADGTLAGATWDPDQPVTALALGHDLVFVGGGFHNVAGQPREYFAAIDVHTDALSGFDVPQPSAVSALETSDSMVYVGRYSGLRAYRTPSAELAWNDSTAYAILTMDWNQGTLYIGGDFVRMQGRTRNYLAAVNVSTGLLTTWDPGADYYVLAVAVANGMCYVAGAFGELGSLIRSRVGAVDLQYGFATGWAPIVNGFVRGLTASSTSVSIVGDFTRAGGQDRLHFASLHPFSGIVDGRILDPNDVAYAVGEDGAEICIGGAFTGYRPVPRRNAAAIDLGTGHVIDWRPDPNQSVFALAAYGGKVYAAGNFNSIGGATRNLFATVDAITGTATSWNPAVNSGVHCFAIQPPFIYVGGSFTSIGGVARARLAAVDLKTDQVSTWNPGSNSSVYGLEARDSTVFACGQFFYIGGLNRYGVAELRLDTGAPTAFDPPAPDNAINCMKVVGSSVFVGGMFSRFATTPRSYIGALDAESGQLLAWNPGVSGYLYTLAAQGPLVYVGGSYNTIGSATRWFLSAVDGTTGLVDPWIADTNNPINAILVRDSHLIVGGNFSRIGCGAQACLAEISIPASLLAVTTTPVRSSALTGHPNPVTRQAVLSFTLARSEPVSVDVYDVTGRRVRTLSSNGMLTAGRHELGLDAAGMAPGIYLCRLRSSHASAEWRFSVLQ